MPKGFILLNDPSYSSAVRVNPVHMVSWVTLRSNGMTRIVMASKDVDGNDTYLVTETPEQIDALIEDAQAENIKAIDYSGFNPAMGEFAQAMGEAVAAFGGARR